MKKDVIRRSNIQLVCGQAKPGANLAFLKNMAVFCRDFNEKTKNLSAEPVNVEITVYSDKTYGYMIKNVPSSYLIKKLLGSRDDKKISSQEIKDILKKVIVSMNTNDEEMAFRTISGTARSFGLKVV
jgi:large subunit ribosomal protein L11